MKRLLFVYNPNAGQRLIKYHLWDILNTFAQSDYELCIYPTKSQGDGYKYIKENAHKFDRVVVSGGDGTLSEAVNAYMSLSFKPPLGYIPAGTTNDFAVSLNIPKNMNQAAELINNSNSVFNIDIGKFNDSYFDYVAAFGIFTDTAYSTPQDIKNLLGHLAYILHGIKSIKDVKSYDITIKTDTEVFSDKFILGMITNTLTIGGLLKLDPNNVSLNDGEFEVILVKEVKDIKDLALIGATLLGDRINSESIIKMKSKNITIESKDDISWTLDGEYGGHNKHVNISVINKALPLITNINKS